MSSSGLNKRPRKVSHYSLGPDASSLVLVREFIRATLEPFEGLRLHLPDVIRATHEAAKNAVANNRDSDAPVEIECRVMDEWVVIEVVDRAPAIGESALPPPEPDPASVTGRGMLLMRSLMDEVEARAGAGGTRITMRKRFSAGRTGR